LLLTKYKIWQKTFFSFFALNKNNWEEAGGLRNRIEAKTKEKLTV
jgi:hypothetical protein